MSDTVVKFGQKLCTYKVRPGDNFVKYHGYSTKIVPMDQFRKKDHFCQNSNIIYYKSMIQDLYLKMATETSFTFYKQNYCNYLMLYRFLLVGFELYLITVSLFELS